MPLSLRWYAPIVLAVSLVAPWRGEAATPGTASAAPCAKHLSGHEYWFYDLTVGVEQASQDDKEILGRVIGAPPFDFCFHAPVAEVQDPIERTKGYVEAVGRMSTSLVSDRRTWDTDPRSLEVRSRLEAVAGMKFKTPEDFGRWYDDRDYLRWSDEQKALIIDRQAKKEQRHITELDVAEISAESYWTLEGSGHLADSVREGEFVRGRYWDGFVERRYKIPATELQDRAAREAGYKKAARVLANQLERHRNPDAKWLALTVNRYEALTGQHLGTKPDAWVQWCRANCDQLHLSADGQHLTLPWQPK